MTSAGSTSENGSRGNLYLLAAVLPYASIVIGLYLLGNIWITVLSYYLGIIAIITAVDKWSLLRRLVRGRRVRSALVGVPLCLLVGPLIVVAWPWTKLSGLSLSASLAELGLDMSSAVMFGCCVVLNPLLEELFWRGFLFTNCRRPAFVDLLFAGYHLLVLVLFVELPWAIAASVVLVVAAWFWRLLTGKLGGLFIPVITHAAADISVVAAVCAISAGCVL